MTYYDQLCLQVHAEISNLRIHHWSFKGTEPLNMNMWVFFLLNVLENVGCKMCCYYHNWYQVAVSRCPWPWNCWQLRKQRPRCKSIIPWQLAGGFQQCWLSSYFQLSSNDGGYFFPWFSMWLCSIFWPIFRCQDNLSIQFLKCVLSLPSSFTPLFSFKAIRAIPCLKTKNACRPKLQRWLRQWANRPKRKRQRSPKASECTSAFQKVGQWRFGTKSHGK